MSAERELTKRRLLEMLGEAIILKRQGKRIILSGGIPLEHALEEKLFKEAEKNIDVTIEERRRNEKKDY